MGTRTDNPPSTPVSNGGPTSHRGGLLDWRVLVGLVSIISGVFVGSRTIVTQQDLIASEARALIERARQGDAIDRLREDLLDRTADRIYRTEWDLQKQAHKTEHETLIQELKEEKQRITRMWDRINDHEKRIAKLEP